MSNVIPLRRGQECLDVAHKVRENNLCDIFESNSFIFVGTIPTDGSVVFNAGPGLSIGDLTYMQKVFNIKCNELINSSMYGEPDGE